MIRKIVAILLVPVIVGAIIVALWDTMMDSDTDIQAITDNGTATVFLQTAWPIILLIIGVVVAAGIIMYAVRKLNLI